MDTSEIRKKIAAKGYTQAEFAEKLGITRETLSRVLKGKQTMTETLRKHIELLLTGPVTPPEPKEAVFVYRINITDREAREICGEKYLGGPGQDPDGKSAAKDKRPGEDGITITPAMETALHAVITYNLRRLARIGAQWEGWSEEDRALLDALDREAADNNQPTPPTAYGEAQEPFA